MIAPIPNDAVYTVSEISGALKATVEKTYGFVRVRGELSEVKQAASGHVYATLKDSGAVLNAIVWKTSMSRLSIRPEDGLEVIATGRMTTYPGRSNYQLVIEQIEVAGEGALLKLIEERRKKLAAEGLFDASRKRALPAYPQRIGVITSPTGAVIRDILHRLADRYPCEVWLWPVLVQGEGAAQQIAHALKSVSELNDKPDVMIVARGGGSLEDLMAFNDEAVVRAAANCPIPLISAVGHETDTTLIDFAADQRAPTPTAAAELATPQRAALVAFLRDAHARLQTSLLRHSEDAQQKLDQTAFRLEGSALRVIDQNRLRLLGLKPRAPEQIVAMHRQALDSLSQRLTQSLVQKIDRLQSAVRSLNPRSPTAILQQQRTALDHAAGRLERVLPVIVSTYADRLANVSRVLKMVSFESTLERGFVLVRDENGHAVTDAGGLQTGQTVTLQFAKDRKKQATISG